MGLGPDCTGTEGTQFPQMGSGKLGIESSTVITHLGEVFSNSFIPLREVFFYLNILCFIYRSFFLVFFMIYSSRQQ